MNRISFVFISIFLLGAYVWYTGYDNLHVDQWVSKSSLASSTANKNSSNSKYFDYPGVDPKTRKEILKMEAESELLSEKFKELEEARIRDMDRMRERDLKRDEEYRKKEIQLRYQEQNLQKQYDLENHPSRRLRNQRRSYTMSN